MSTNKHLTEKDLIEFQFKLASDEQTQRIADHLKSCNKCAEQLEKLKRKFASLDLLRSDVKASEELVSKVVKQTQKPAKAKIFSLTKSAWLSAAAVVALGIILFSSVNRNNQPPTNVSEPNQSNSDVAQVPPEKNSVDNFSMGVPDAEKDGGTMVTTATTNQETELPSRSTLAGRGGGRGMRSEGNVPPVAAAPETYALAQEPADITEESDIGEQPFFAPASAIELVTLPRRENVQLTIYNSADLTLVREKRNLTLKRGWNWLQFMWANTLIDPTSLSLEPKEQKDKIDIQALVFPARLRQIGRWLIRSEVSGQVPFEITYLTSGLGWRAFYMGTLSEDEKSMGIKGYVRVSNNSGEDYENAQTRLIVGQVHMLDQIADLARRQYPYNRPNPTVRHNVLLEDSYDFFSSYGTGNKWYANQLREFDFEKKEIVKEGLSEYFLYTIEGTETIENQWSKRLLSFEANDINVESLYKYDETRYGNQTIRFVKFKNDEDHNLGETPIPDGNVKIYGLADQQGDLSYVGGTNIKYIPVNEEVELNLGAARLVEVKPKMMDLKTDNYTYDPNGNITGWDEIRTWKIEITNTRQIPVTVEITRDFGTSYWTLQSETPYDKYDVTRARFNLNIESRTKQEIEYIVTTYHGIRQEEYNQ